MEQRTHAVVLGASMAGLLAARALSDHFERVTVVERDALPGDSGNRKGVPQGHHAHGLLASGYRVMDAYFPGMMDELEEAGAPRGDVTGNFLWYQYGRWKLRHDSGLRGILVSRPCLESAIRSRVKSVPNVTFAEHHDGDEPVFDRSAGRVTGLRAVDRANGADRVIDADLVVDGSGRGSQTPKWVKERGFREVPVSLVKVDVGYATRVLERSPGDFRDSVGGIIAGTAPQSRDGLLGQFVRPAADLPFPAGHRVDVGTDRFVAITLRDLGCRPRAGPVAPCPWPRGLSGGPPGREPCSRRARRTRSAGGASHESIAPGRVMSAPRRPGWCRGAPSAPARVRRRD